LCVINAVDDLMLGCLAPKCVRIGLTAHSVSKVPSFASTLALLGVTHTYEDDKAPVETRSVQVRRSREEAKYEHHDQCCNGPDVQERAEPA
jgi:hypothetical protein